MSTLVVKTIAVVAECVGQVLSERACLMMATALEQYPENVVIQALHDCLRTLKSRLTLNAIIECIHANDGHPSPYEAWAIAIEAMNEYRTIALTAPIMKATAAAKPLLNLGDKIGARIAFIAAYEQELDAVRKRCEPAHWMLSLGHDAASREAGRQAAIDSGKLSLKQCGTTCLITPAAYGFIEPDNENPEKTFKARDNISKLKTMVNETFNRQTMAKQYEQRLKRIETYLLKRKQRELLRKENLRRALVSQTMLEQETV